MSMRTVVGVLLVLMTLSLAGMLLLRAPWDSLSSNLFASWITIALTIFGIDVLLKRIRERERAPYVIALREPLIGSIVYALNRSYNTARGTFDQAAGKSLVAVDDRPTV